MKFCKFGLGILLVLALLASYFPGSGLQSNAGAEKDTVNVRPDSWDAVDGLGRILSGAGEVREKRDDKFVGMFYWTWHGHEDFAGTTIPRVAGEIVKQYPEAKNDFWHSAWEGTESGTKYFWGEPLYGFYTTTDPFVLRKHAELLADAGVDVIIFDCTNGRWTWEESYMPLLETFAKARADGVNTPQIAFMLNFSGNSNALAQLVTLYENLYRQGLYEDLWFLWEGKPLIMAHPSALTGAEDIIGEMADEIRNFFTFRRNESSYFAQNTSYEDQFWGWCSVYPQTKYGVREDGSVEQMTVSVAQNAIDYMLVAMNSMLDGVHGRSFTNGNYSYTYRRYGKEKVMVSGETENAMLYGLQFQQQWDYALSVDPDFIFITGWNEWVAGRHLEWSGTQNAFPDEFSEEYSRDIEPAKGILADHFYYQLVENIRRYKGVSQWQDRVAKQTIDPAGGAAAWENVTTSYDDYVDDTAGRNSVGYVDTFYTAEPVRNDILHAKFAYDNTNLYFMVQTREEISPYTDPKWMRLLIRVEGDDDAMWEGFDYIVNRNSPSASEATLERFTGGWNFETAGTVSYTVVGDTMTITIPKKMLGIRRIGKLPVICFKWVDNAIDSEEGDIMDVYEHGDAAPDFRFVYRVDVNGRRGNGTETALVALCCFSVLMAGIGLSTYYLKKKKLNAEKTVVICAEHDTINE